MGSISKLNMSICLICVFLFTSYLIHVLFRVYFRTHSPNAFFFLVGYWIFEDDKHGHYTVMVFYYFGLLFCRNLMVLLSCTFQNIGYEILYTMMNLM